MQTLLLSSPTYLCGLLTTNNQVKDKSFMVIMLPVEKKCGYICIVLKIFKIPELSPPLKSHSNIHPSLGKPFCSSCAGRWGGENAIYACACLSSDWQADRPPCGPDWRKSTGSGGILPIALQTVGGARGAGFFLYYIIHVVLLEHRVSFSKYDRKLDLPTASLNAEIELHYIVLYDCDKWYKVSSFQQSSGWQ